MVTVKLRSGIVYVAAFAGYYKIGRTNDLDRRLKSLLPTAFPEQPALRYSFHVPDAGLVEKSLHQHFEANRVHGEWFALSSNELDSIPAYIEQFDYNTKPKHKRPVLATQAERIYANALYHEAGLHPIHRLPKVLRKLRPGKMVGVATTNLAAVRSIERKFGFKLMLPPNDTSIHVVKVA